MKKTILLSSILAVSMAFADKTVDSTEVAVMGLTIPSKATLFAVPFLGYTTDAITVADMVNTAELAEDSKLYVPNTDGTYDVWTLGEDKKWKETQTNVNIGNGDNGDTSTSESAGVAAKAVQTGRGGAFWLEPASGSGIFYLLGKPASDAGTSTAVGGKWNLVGNASEAALTTLKAAAAQRDQVAIQIDGKLRYYMYMGADNGWCYQRSNDGGWETKQNLPVALGQGLWFKPAATATINWADGTITPVVGQ